jgi:NADPH-dependent ferric siderophore reductase
VIEVAGPEDELPLEGDIRWCHRGATPAHDSATLREAVAQLDFPIGAAYLAGEARTTQAVRKHLVEERNWPRRSVLTKPFWTPGKTGME